MVYHAWVSWSCRDYGSYDCSFREFFNNGLSKSPKFQCMNHWAIQPPHLTQKYSKPLQSGVWSLYIRKISVLYIVTNWRYRRYFVSSRHWLLCIATIKLIHCLYYFAVITNYNIIPIESWWSWDISHNYYIHAPETWLTI